MAGSSTHPTLVRSLQRFETATEGLKLKLPKALTDALAGMHSAGAHADQCGLESTEARIAVEAAERELRADAVDAASEGKATRLDVSQLFKAEERHRHLERELPLLTEVFESSIAHAYTELLDSAEQIIVETLRPRLDALLEDAKELVKPLGNVGSPAEALAAGERASTAWRKLGAHAAEWGNLSRVYSLLYDLAFGGQTQDVTGYVSTFRTPPEPVLHAIRSDGPLPWPEDPTGRLVTVIVEDWQPWFPLPHERDSAIRPLRERHAWMHPPLRPPAARGASWEEPVVTIDGG